MEINGLGIATSEVTMNSTIIDFVTKMVDLDAVEYGATLVYDYDVSEINCFVFGNSSS